MSIAEVPEVTPLSPPATNGVSSNGVVETVTRQDFQEGPCTHKAKKSIVKGKQYNTTIKKERNAKEKKCAECVRKSEDSTSKTAKENVLTSLCLSCGSRLCETHAIAHSKIARTGETHPFFYDEDLDRVRCFSCEVIVDVTDCNHIKMVLSDLKSLFNGKAKGGKAGDKSPAVEEQPTVLDKPESKPEKKPSMSHSSQNGPSSSEEGKKANGLKKSERPAVPPKNVDNGHVNGTGSEDTKKNGLSVPRSTALPAKGLSNLGNTCFFNSVMQCMLHTHHLAYYLDRFGRVSRLNFPKPATVIVNDEKVEIEEATLLIPCKYSPINEALKAFVVDFRNGRTPSPNNLFSQISVKATRFRSMAQQDAHELLRYLMDGLCSEETARYQSAIAALVGAPLKSATKADQGTVRKAKAYLQLAGRPLLDAVFGGRLLQTIRCSKCHHVSERYENLYDLSVPLTGGSNGRSASRANGVLLANQTTSSSSSRPPSKHQQKKELAAAKRAKKNSRSLKSQASKTGEEETIEDKMAALRVNGDKESEGGSSEDEDEEKEKENEVEGKAEEPESSGNEEDNNSYRPLEKTVDPLDLTKVLTTMSTPLPSGQSIAASLLEFTAEEMLEGANAYECEKCCTPVNKKKGATGAAKTRVEATKRYLIYTPPVVLTIHIKRFQQIHTGAKVTTRKVSGKVDFPLIFDIAPFCCKNVERVAPGQTSILYSLYGVVVHSGSLSGGHYVAYVKSREKIEKSEEMLETARVMCADIQAEEPRAASPSLARRTKEEAINDVPSGQWYYCSDSRVSAVSEKNVLNEEAYLLFYERIY